MRLWTWQNKDFDIRNGETPVKSLPYSPYLNDSNHPEDRKRRRKANIKLWKKLGDCQFHWYFTDEQEAKSDASFHQYEKYGKALWELEVSIDSIYKKVCATAWCILLEERIIYTSEFFNCWRRKAFEKSPSKAHQIIEKYKQQFEEYWNDKSEEDLWNCLFLNHIVPGCTQILLKHPVEGNCVTRNPLEEGRWWDIFRSNLMTQGNNEALPCKKCPGKK